MLQLVKESIRFPGKLLLTQDLQINLLVGDRRPGLMRNVGDQLLHLLFRLQAFLRLPLLYMLDPGQLFIYLPGKGILCLLIFFKGFPVRRASRFSSRNSVNA